MEEELTDRQLETIDALHNAVWQVMCEITGMDLEWDMYWIGPISDYLVDYAVNHFGCDEMEIYL